MPSWLLSILKTVGNFLLPHVVKELGEHFRQWLISRQNDKNKKKAEEYAKDKSKSNADDLIDGL